MKGVTKYKFSNFIKRKKFAQIKTYLNNFFIILLNKKLTKLLILVVR